MLPWPWLRLHAYMGQGLKDYANIASVKLKKIPRVTMIGGFHHEYKQNVQRHTMTMNKNIKDI